MADATDVTRLRRLTSEPDVPPAGTYTNLELSNFIDELGTVELAAARVWREKAAAYAGLVDTTEGSSSRKLSQLRLQALEMAKVFDPAATVEAATDDRPRSRAIVRG